MFAFDQFKLKSVKEEKDYGNFSLGPLPTGYGVTLGNTLRRILLSSIEGAAITSVKINGVKHEYSTIPGVMDDVLSILLKLKQISFKCTSDKPQTLELKVKGKRIVKASDIKITSDVEIANPDTEITELTDQKAKLDIEIQVERGRGYIPTDEGKRGEIGVIPLDANFSPVKRVVISVTKSRVGQQTDLDQLNIEIVTNGTISPRVALEQTFEIYHIITSRLISVMKGEEAELKEEVKEAKKVDSQSADLDIDKLNLSARLTNSLLKSGYKNLTELEGKSIEELLEIRGLGQRSVEELVDIMKSYKLKIVE
jgi:DNA-directed RNA polymerase subunit alpha